MAGMRKMDESIMGYCGLDCSKCPIFIATANNDMEFKDKTAKEWSKLYAEYIGKDKLEPDDCNCNGCRIEGETFVGCLNCDIRSCAMERNFETCADCEKYRECEMITGFFQIPSHEEAKDNLERIRSSKEF